MIPALTSSVRVSMHPAPVFVVVDAAAEIEIPDRLASFQLRPPGDVARVLREIAATEEPDLGIEVGLDRVVLRRHVHFVVLPGGAEPLGQIEALPIRRVAPEEIASRTATCPARSTHRRRRRDCSRRLMVESRPVTMRADERIPQQIPPHAADDVVVGMASWIARSPVRVARVQLLGSHRQEADVVSRPPSPTGACHR